MNYTWTHGYLVPKTELIMTLIRAHIKAVQEYDHYGADEIEEYLLELCERHAKAKWGQS
jgi:hypothetical protein